MADADVPISAGTGTKIDTRTVGAGTDEHRQVVVIGDPTTAANVAIVDSSGRILAVVQGNVAHDDVDSGNPVKMGGKARTAQPGAVAANDRVDAWFGPDGHLIVSDLASATGGAGGDAVANVGQRATPDGGSTSAPTTSAPFVFNGTTWDRIRSAGVTGMQGIGGATAADSPVAASPVTVGARASTAIPAAMSADGDVVNVWANRNGAQMMSTAPHIGLNSDPWNLVHEGAQYTSAQTSTVFVAGGASEKIVVTKVQIQAYGTTAGTAILYFGTGAYSRGTSRAVFDGEFAPSATLKPGVVLDGPFIAGTNGDDLMVTTTNALSITFSVWYYVIT